MANRKSPEEWVREYREQTFMPNILSTKPKAPTGPKQLDLSKLPLDVILANENFNSLIGDVNSAGKFSGAIQQQGLNPNNAQMEQLYNQVKALSNSLTTTKQVPKSFLGIEYTGTEQIPPTPGQLQRDLPRPAEAKLTDEQFKLREAYRDDAFNRAIEIAKRNNIPPDKVQQIYEDIVSGYENKDMNDEPSYNPWYKLGSRYNEPSKPLKDLIKGKASKAAPKWEFVEE